MTSETFEMEDSVLGFSDHILGAQTLPTSRTFRSKLPEKQKKMIQRQREEKNIIIYHYNT